MNDRRFSPWLLSLLLLGASGASAQTLSITDVMISEGDFGSQNAILFVNLSGPTPLTVTVDYFTQDDGAVAGEDYLPATGTLTFTGTTTQQIAVPILGDLMVEGDETFIVILENSSGATVADDSGQVTILNDDQPVEPSIDDAVVTEGDSGTVSAVFDVRLAAPAQIEVILTYFTRDASATAGEDYRATTGSVTLAPGSTLARIAIDVFGDTLDEDDETFDVVLVDSTGVAVDDAECTIVDDDEPPPPPEPPDLAIGGAGVLEGDAGTVGAVFNVTLSEATEGTVTVSYTSRDGTATAASGDYQSASGPLTFAPGETLKRVTVEVVGDTRVEPDETFFVDLSNADGAEIVDGQGEGTILNDDEEPPEPPTVSIDDATVVEGGDGVALVTFSVELSRMTGAVDGTITVDYATEDSTATAADDDYRPASGTLSFPPGQIEREVTVEVLGDERVEADEVFAVVLSNPDGAIIADGRGEATILNDDEEPSRIRFADVPSVAEGAGTARVSVERFAGADRAARVTIEAVAGTATAGEDFRLASRQLAWDAGERGRKVFELEILDDSLEEDDETVILRLSSPVDSRLVDRAEATLVILDDDAPMGLDPVGEAELSAEVGEEIELQVRATSDDGAPVEGATVAWSVEGDAELASGERTPTDEGGLATQLLRLGSRAGEVMVTATIEGVDRGVEFMVTVEADLADATDPMSDPGDAAVAQALDESCRQATGEFGDMCDYLTALDETADQQAAIAELTPEEIAAQGQLSLGAQKTQLGNIGARLAALRGGATRQTLEQLAVLIRGRPLDLGGIRASWRARYDDHRFAKRVDSALARALAGGLAAADEDIPEAASGAPRWGLFVNGRISIGDRPTTVRETGFDFETLGLTAGADYRVNDRLVLGGAVGYLDSDTDLVQDGGRLDASGYSLSAYGSYYRQKFYLDGVLSYGRNEYDVTRNIDLPQPFQGRQRFTALGSPDGSQISASLGAGYEGQVRAWSLGGYGGLSWIDSEIDGYAETGAGPFNLAIADQDVESLLSEAGVEVAYASSQSWGVLRPTLRLSWLHEFEDDARLIRSRFVDDLTANQFVIPTEEPDRDFFNVTTGLTATLARGRTLFLVYDTDLERDDLDVYTFTVGARFELGR